MIVRIMGEGQWTLGDEQADVLNSLDASLESAVEAGDQQAFAAALADLLGQTRAGTEVEHDLGAGVCSLELAAEFGERLLQ